MVKGRRCRPARTCRKIAGPGEVSRIAKAMIPNSGERSSKAGATQARSNRRLSREAHQGLTRQAMARFSCPDWYRWSASGARRCRRAVFPARCRPEILASSGFPGGNVLLLNSESPQCSIVLPDFTALAYSERCCCSSRSSRQRLPTVLHSADRDVEIQSKVSVLLVTLILSISGDQHQFLPVLPVLIPKVPNLKQGCPFWDTRKSECYTTGSRFGDVSVPHSRFCKDQKSQVCGTLVICFLNEFKRIVQGSKMNPTGLSVVCGEFGPRQKTHSADSCRESGLHVGVSIPDQQRFSKVDLVIASRLQQHARIRFSAETIPPVFLDCRFRVMGTVVIPIQDDALIRKLPAHPLHQPMELFFRVDLTGNPGLIGDDYQSIPQGLRGAA